MGGFGDGVVNKKAESRLVGDEDAWVWGSQGKRGMENEHRLQAGGMWGTTALSEYPVSTAGSLLVFR